MKIVFSRKGFDDQYGGIPSVIWPNSREMLSFPIPVRSLEKGHRAEDLSFMGHRLNKLLFDLKYNWNRHGDSFHFDPMIQPLLPENTLVGAFGQSGSALGHLKKNHISKGDIFLFFGTFCECYWDGDRLSYYKMMHPFHAIWGFLEVDSCNDISQIISETTNEIINAYPGLRSHPHIKNREIYKSHNTLFIGRNFGTFRYSQLLRLSKENFKKSVWELPEDFREVKISHVKLADVQKDPPRVDFYTASKGQEFILEDPNDGIMEWLNSILEMKIV